MTKLEFINALGDELTTMPREEAKKVLEYYLESVDDRMEDGMTEEKAIDALGPIPELAQRALEEYRQENAVLPVPKAPVPEVEVVFEAPPKRKLPVWAIILLIIGSPIWLGIGLGIGGAFLGIYISLWAILASLLFSAGAFLICGAIGAVASWFLPISPTGVFGRVFAFGCCIALMGVGMLLLPGMLWLIRGFVSLHKWVFRKLRGGKRG